MTTSPVPSPPPRTSRCGEGSSRTALTLSRAILRRTAMKLSQSQTLVFLSIFSIMLGLLGSGFLISWSAQSDHSAALDFLRAPVPGISEEAGDARYRQNKQNSDLQSSRGKARLVSLGRFAPRAMVGLLMIDTPEAKLRRMILRIIFPPEHVILRFVICRPTAATALEDDVVAIDMEENMNEGKTHRWFEYAVKNVPSSVKAVFKLDTDAMFCLSDLHKQMLKAEGRSAYSYYGVFMNHASCSTSGFDHCPPAQCNNNNKMVGDCWYYMSGGFYGFSVPLLREIARTPLFQAYSTGPQENHHEDVMSGRWVNETLSRALVSEEHFDYFHAKWLAEIIPPRIDNYFKAYFLTLKERGCQKEAEDVKSEFERMYANTPWKPNATEAFK